MRQKAREQKQDCQRTEQVLKLRLEFLEEHLHLRRVSRVGDERLHGVIGDVVLAEGSEPVAEERGVNRREVLVRADLQSCGLMHRETGATLRSCRKNRMVIYLQDALEDAAGDRMFDD